MMRQGFGLALALLAGISPAAGQMRPVRPAEAVSVPNIAPLLEKVCLPVANGQAVAAGIAAAKSVGFAVTATHEQMATLEREEMTLNLRPDSCQLTLNQAGDATFPHMDQELRRWLPRLGRYWAGALQGDAGGFNARKFRAGGHTIQLWEVVDEGERSVNVEIEK